MISEFPLFTFTTLAGLAAGAYLIDVIFALRGTKSESAGRAVKPWVFPLVCLILLGVGLIGCLAHLGRPERFMNALANPTAMIAQEAYWSIAFGMFALVDFIMGLMGKKTPNVVRIIGAVAGAGLMVVMSNAYFTAHGVGAWTHPLTWLLFLVGDLAMGAALVGALRSAVVQDSAFRIMALVLYCVVALATIGECVNFASHGHSVVPFAIAAVITAAGIVVDCVARNRKMKPEAVAIGVCVLIIIGVAISRYGFYMASII